MNSKSITCVMAAVTVLFAMACGQGVPPSEELVPEGSNLIVGVQLGKFLQDQDIQELYASLPKDEDQPATFKGLLDLAREETGVDLGVFSKVVLFGSTTREDFFAVIAEGSFDRDALLRGIEQAAGVEVSAGEYKGHELRSFTIGDQETSLVFLDKETLAFGNPQAVRQVVDVLEGDRGNVRGRVLDIYDALTDAWVKAAFEVPALALGFIPEEIGEVPINLRPFRDLQVIGVGVDKNAEEIKARVVADFLTEESATDAGETLDGAVKLFRGLVTDDTVKDLLSRLEVTHKGSTVTVTFDSSMMDLQELIEQPLELETGDIFGGLFGSEELAPVIVSVPAPVAVPVPAPVDAPAPTAAAVVGPAPQPAVSRGGAFGFAPHTLYSNLTGLTPPPGAIVLVGSSSVDAGEASAEIALETDMEPELLLEHYRQVLNPEWDVRQIAAAGDLAALTWTFREENGFTWLGVLQVTVAGPGQRWVRVWTAGGVPESQRWICDDQGGCSRSGPG